MKFCHLKTQSVSLSRETSEIQSEWLICSWQSVTEPLRAMPNNQNLCNWKEISDKITTGWHVKQQSCHTQYKHNISFITQMEHACSSNTADKSQEGTLASEHAWEIQTDTAAASALIQCVCVYRGRVRHVPVNKSNTLCLSVVLVTLLLHWLLQVKITLLSGSDLYIHVTSVLHYKTHRSDADSDWTSRVQSRCTMLINDAGDWSYWQTQTAYS